MNNIPLYWLLNDLQKSRMRCCHLDQFNTGEVWIYLSIYIYFITPTFISSQFALNPNPYDENSNGNAVSETKQCRWSGWIKRQECVKCADGVDHENNYGKL